MGMMLHRHWEDKAEPAKRPMPEQSTRGKSEPSEEAPTRRGRPKKSEND